MGLVQFIPYENWFHALPNTSGLVFVHLTPGLILLNPSTIRPRALAWGHLTFAGMGPKGQSWFELGGTLEIL